MSDVDVLEMEGSPETANYRKSRLVLWETIRAAYDDYVADGMKVVEEAKKRGATRPTEEEVRTAAGRYIRGEVRAFMTEILTRAPAPAIIQFLSVSRDWGDGGEKLLEHDAAVRELIQSAYPKRTWASKMDALAKAVAANDASWNAWVVAWGEEFAATGRAARDAVVSAGKAVGQVGLGLADGLATLLRWGPYIAAGAAVVGVATVAVVVTRK
jgi:hypothetical protein